jgi:hypothetical protein
VAWFKTKREEEKAGKRKAFFRGDRGSRFDDRLGDGGDGDGEGEGFYNERGGRGGAVQVECS